MLIFASLSGMYWLSKYTTVEGFIFVDLPTALEGAAIDGKQVEVAHGPVHPLDHVRERQPVRCLDEGAEHQDIGDSRVAHGIGLRCEVMGDDVDVVAAAVGRNLDAVEDDPASRYDRRQELPQRGFVHREQHVR